jgi:hypothetical protein
MTAGIEIESVLSPDGEFAVELTMPVTPRWFKRIPEPIYLTKAEARQLSRELMQATGFTPHVVLDEEEVKLRRDLADPDLGYRDRQDIEVALAVVGLIRRMWHPEGIDG